MGSHRGDSIQDATLVLMSQQPVFSAFTLGWASFVRAYGCRFLMCFTPRRIQLARPLASCKRWIGLLMGIADDPEGQARIAVFSRHFTPWAGQRGPVIYRWSAGDVWKRARSLKALLHFRSDIILAKFDARRCRGQGYPPARRRRSLSR
jgi:hypothetical protein